MRNVMIAAPSHDGNVNVWYVFALAETIKLGLARNINISPIFVSFDSLVQRARNDIVRIALDSGVDDLVFIDTDQDWNPEDLFTLLSHDVDIVGAPVPKKSDQEAYNVKLLGDYEVQDNGLVAVDGIGTGMLRLTYEALDQLWDASESYMESDKEQECRMVFDVKVVDGQLWSEDNVMCQKWKDLGGTVWIDPTINCGHVGIKKWVGRFEDWIDEVQLK